MCLHALDVESTLVQHWNGLLDLVSMLFQPCLFAGIGIVCTCLFWHIAIFACWVKQSISHSDGCIQTAFYKRPIRPSKVDLMVLRFLWGLKFQDWLVGIIKHWISMNTNRNIMKLWVLILVRSAVNNSLKASGRGSAGKVNHRINF